MYFCLSIFNFVHKEYTLKFVSEKKERRNICYLLKLFFQLCPSKPPIKLPFYHQNWCNSGVYLYQFWLWLSSSSPSPSTQFLLPTHDEVASLSHPKTYSPLDLFLSRITAILPHLVALFNFSLPSPSQLVSNLLQFVLSLKKKTWP